MGSSYGIFVRVNQIVDGYENIGIEFFVMVPQASFLPAPGADDWYLV
jgi:hypothetical protein